MSAAAQALGLPPGLNFRPDTDELIALYLFPRACGQASAIRGVVIDDEGTGAAVPPWEVLARHGRTADNGAYFFERIREEEGKSRGCGGGKWTWVIQQSTPDKVLRLPGGEEVWWNKKALNLHKGRRRSGSTGWVMHEYTITSPPCPFPVKICHVSFSGRGQKRNRVPNDDQQRQSKRAAAESSRSEASTTTFLDQELPLPLGQGQERFLDQRTHGFNQELAYNQQQQSQEDFLESYNEGSSVLTFGGPDVGSSQETCPGQQKHAYNQQQQSQGKFLESYNEGSSVLTFGGPDVGSSQETCPGQQGLAYNQQQQQSQDNFFDYEAYGAFLESDVGAIQEHPAVRTLTQEQLFEQKLNHFLGTSTNADTSKTEEHIQMTEDTGTSTTPPLTDPGSPVPWENLEVFCYVPPE